MFTANIVSLCSRSLSLAVCVYVFILFLRVLLFSLGVMAAAAATATFFLSLFFARSFRFVCCYLKFMCASYFEISSAKLIAKSAHC